MQLNTGVAGWPFKTGNGRSPGCKTAELHFDYYVVGPSRMTTFLAGPYAMAMDVLGSRQVAKLPNCQVAEFLNHQVAKLPSYRIAKLPSCRIAKLPKRKLGLFRRSCAPWRSWVVLFARPASRAGLFMEVEIWKRRGVTVGRPKAKYGRAPPHVSCKKQLNQRASTQLWPRHIWRQQVPLQCAIAGCRTWRSV